MIRRRLVELSAIALCGCASARHPAASVERRGIDVLVIAPHPDDEVLIAGGVLARAVAEGKQVAVVVMTNGDYDCVHDGLVRERETIEGLAKLGVGEDRVRFLGYPDGALPLLGTTALARRRLDREGHCIDADETYGERGAGRAEAHRLRTGRPAKYRREAVVGDLASMLDELRPADVYLTHPVDTHPDHAATYTLFREALDRTATAPRVHRAIVHAADCWPLGPQPKEPCPLDPVDPSRPTPNLTGRLAGYVPRERVLVPRGWSRGHDNPKVAAIAAYASQTRSSYESYLFSFARDDETFFPESFVRETEPHRRWVRADAPAKAATFSFEVERRGGSFDLERDGRGYTLSFLAGTGAELHARSPDGSTIRLQTWPLPHDLWTNRPTERFDLVFEWRPADGPVIEISLRRDEALLGTTVDVSASPSALHAR